MCRPSGLKKLRKPWQPLRCAMDGLTPEEHDDATDGDEHGPWRRSPRQLPISANHDGDESEEVGAGGPPPEYEDLAELPDCEEDILKVLGVR